MESPLGLAVAPVELALIKFRDGAIPGGSRFVQEKHLPLMAQDFAQDRGSAAWRPDNEDRRDDRHWRAPIAYERETTIEVAHPRTRGDAADKAETAHREPACARPKTVDKRVELALKAKDLRRVLRPRGNGHRATADTVILLSGIEQWYGIPVACGIISRFRRDSELAHGKSLLRSWETEEGHER
jgi:hypothetical protein